MPRLLGSEAIAPRSRRSHQRPPLWVDGADETMRIGELAHRAGIATSAIRFYEEEGLLPEPHRTASGYRDYTPEVLDHLTFIQCGQAIGLTLEQVKQLLQIREAGEIPCVHVAGFLNECIAAIDQTTHDLRRLRHHLIELTEEADRVDPTS